MVFKVCLFFSFHFFLMAASEPRSFPFLKNKLQFFSQRGVTSARVRMGVTGHGRRDAG